MNMSHLHLKTPRSAILTQAKPFRGAHGLSARGAAAAYLRGAEHGPPALKLKAASTLTHLEAGCF